MKQVRAVGVGLREFFFPERGVLRPLSYAAVAALGLSLGLALAALDLTQRLDWSLYDRLMRAATRDPHPPSDIIIVAIDELSFSQIGLQWPWPRRLHAALVNGLRRAGARTIVLDLLFDTPSTPEDDGALAEAMRMAGNVVLASDRALVTDRAYSVQQWVDPIPPLAGAAAAIGAVGIDFDPDGVLRRTSLVVDGRPTLAAAAALRRQGFALPLNPERPRLIHFVGPPRRGIVTVSYYQALDAASLLPAGLFAGKTVFVGRSLSAESSVELVPDHFPTPVSIRMAGVEVHASLLDTVLRNLAIADPFGSYVWFALLAVALGALGGTALYRLGPVGGLSLTVASGVVLVMLGFVLLARFSVRIPVMGPFATIAAVYAVTAAYRFALGQRERRLIKRAFQHYVAPAIVQQMLDDPTKLTLGGERYEVTVLFSDLEGFATIAERLTPEQLRTRLGTYFKEMMDRLLAERATLDKFIGDAIMVYFGCPVADPRHPEQACRGALAMQRRMRELNRQWRESGLPELRTRIGVNTGTVVAGNLGTDTIFNYTIIGDCVNLASRLEGANKEYQTLTLVGEDTWSRLGGKFEGREIDLIRVKGKARPVAIYELAGLSGELSPQTRELHARFAAGMAFYRARQWADATAAFRGALEIDGTDGPSRTFVKRCAHYAANSPGDDWDRVHVMHTK